MARHPLPFSLSALHTALFGLAFALVAGCAPTCEQTCRKVLFDCDLNSERVALQECTDSCQRQDALYDAWDNQELQELFRDHRACIGRSSCEEIADQVCYEGFEDLFIFDSSAR